VKECYFQPDVFSSALWVFVLNSCFQFLAISVTFYTSCLSYRRIDYDHPT
jgi:hypothetical protein